MGHNTFWECYIQGAPRKKQYHRSFRGTPKISRKMTSTHSLWVNSGKSKEKQLDLGHYMFWNCEIQGAPRMEQCHSSFAGAPKFSRKIEFYAFT